MELYKMFTETHKRQKFLKRAKIKSKCSKWKRVPNRVDISSTISIINLNVSHPNIAKT